MTPARAYAAALSLCVIALGAVAWAGFGAAQGGPGGGGFSPATGNGGAPSAPAAVATYSYAFPDVGLATTKIYVSDSAGNDSNDGLSEGQAKKTISAALALVTSGTHTTVYLKRGDVFVGQTLETNEAHSGKSATEPLSIAAYGTGARPVIQPTANQNALSITGGSMTYFRLFQDLDIYWAERDPNHASYVGNGTGGGFYSLNGINTFLVLRCSFRFGKDVNLQDFDDLGHYGKIVFRECTFENCYDSDDDRASGIFCSAGQVGTPFSQLLIQRCVFYHCGWNTDATPPSARGVFSHGIYFDDQAAAAATSETDGPCVVEDSVFLKTAANGVQLRAGGIVRDSLFALNPISILIGGGDTPVPGGVTGSALNNVILEGEDNGSAYSWGIDLSNILSCTVSGNRLANAGTPSSTFAILDVANTTYSDNVSHNWVMTVPHSNEKLTDTSETYTRSLATFSSNQGGAGTTQDAIDGLISRAYSVDDALTYFRAGF